MGRCWSHTPETIARMVAYQRSRPRIMVDCLCRACGSSFKRWPSELKYGKGKHCSRACADADRKGSSNPFFGRSHSEASKDLISKSRTGKHGGPSNHNWCGGVTLQTGREFFTPAVRRKWLAEACARCGTAQRLELDHILPVFAGGKSVRSNIQTLCAPCNKRKFQHEDRQKYKHPVSASMHR